MEQVCANLPGGVVAVIGMVVAGASMITNVVPAPDEVTNPVMKIISKILHFVSMDIVTAAKK